MPQPTPSNPKATEERLDEIRKAAADKAPPVGQDRGPAKHPPQIRGRESYYGLPVLKAPVWTWEIPLYFFAGGIAGVSAVIAFAAQVFGSDPALTRAALWVAIAGATICPVLLIADLGRPERFLAMLRVAKIQSPMSVGVWTLVAFSGCVFVALVGNELILRAYVSPFTIGIRWAGELTGALTGLILAAYTGVLIGATANPVWSHNRLALPPHFLASAVGGAAGVLELIGFLNPATQLLGLVAAVAETLLGVHFELSRLPVNAPLHRGKSAWTFRIAGTLAGPGALLLRLMSESASGRRAAAICFLVGSLLSRYAWIWAGVASAEDPEALFQIQRKA
ncbi:MAG: NrfD/PsrC family molybdoenzyme membrane anchor subunit [Candidatus Sulfotelmatobacter sp.]